MADHFLVDALGARVPIDLGEASEQIRASVRAAWRDAASSLQAHRATMTPPVLLRGLSESEVMFNLSSDVTRAGIDAGRGELWMLHAGALALPDGRVLVFVGPSGSGKTTVCRALGGQLGYVTDEATAITPDGEILPYRKPLSLKRQRALKTQVAPSRLGLLPPPSTPLRLARIVLLDRRDDGPVVPDVMPVGLADALGDLVAQTSYLSELPRPLHRIRSHVTETGGILRVTYRESAELVPLAAGLADMLHDGGSAQFGADPDEDGGREHDGAVTDHATARSSGHRYSGVEPLDELRLDDGTRIALLHPPTHEDGPALHVLDGIGPTLWECARSSTVDELTAAVVNRFGPPKGGDAVALVRSAVEELRQFGVLQRTTGHLR